MPIPREAPVPSDSLRDAKKYHLLLLALERATGEIRAMERRGRPDIDEVLDSLLPDLAEAMGAEWAFVALLREEQKERWLELTAVHPQKDLQGYRLECTGLLQGLIGNGERRVIDPLGGPPSPVPELELFNATSTVLVSIEQTRIVGVCNRRLPEWEPYLAPDAKALESIVELVAAGIRVGEVMYQAERRRRQALESIQHTLMAISAEPDLGLLLDMVCSKAAEIFTAPATSLMLWDEERENLVTKAGHGLSPAYLRGQRIPREELGDATESFITPDIQITPCGDPDLIENEDLRTVLRAPLMVSNEVIGILNIYYKEEPQPFTPDEIVLAKISASIFANQAAIAIQNARRYEDLEKTRGELAAIEAVAWMGILGSSWSHGVNQKSFAIRNYVEVLRALVPSEPKVEDVLSKIEAAADDIKNIPITQPLPTTPGTSHGVMEIDDALRKQVQKWCRPRQDIHVQFDLHCPDVQAQIDREWLAVALEKLVSNALRAMADGGALTVSSERVGDQVRICLADTGRGIPDYAREHFLKDRIPKEDGSGTGVGVLIAQLIFRRYGGELSLLWTETGRGTTLEILLPVEGASP
jgi:signal transduction histidine kinase